MWKYLALCVAGFALAVSLQGCAGKPVIENPPCDNIMNRDDQFVCGKDEVLKACRQVPDKSVFVCNKL